MDSKIPSTPSYLQTLPQPLPNAVTVSRQLTEVPFAGKDVKQRTDSKLEVPTPSDKKTADEAKPLQTRKIKKPDTQAKPKSHKHNSQSKGHKDSSRTPIFGESRFGIRDGITNSFHRVLQALGLEESKATDEHDAANIHTVINSSNHSSTLLIVNNAIFHLVNTIDNHFFGDRIPDDSLNKVKDILGKVIEYVNDSVLPAIISKTQKPGDGLGVSQAQPSLQEIIDANKKENAIAESLPKALQALTGVAGLKPKSLAPGEKIQLAFAAGKMNLAKAIELIKEIFKTDHHLGSLLLDLIPLVTRPILGEHKSEKIESPSLN
jgi:hypothetical protein